MGTFGFLWPHARDQKLETLEIAQVDHIATQVTTIVCWPMESSFSTQVALLLSSGKKIRHSAATFGRIYPCESLLAIEVTDSRSNIVPTSPELNKFGTLCKSFMDRVTRSYVSQLSGLG